MVVWLAKLLKSFLFLFLIIFIFPPVCSAQVVINEFSSNNETDWVEVYNNTGEIVDLSLYYLADAVDNTKNMDCYLAGHGSYAIDWGNKLNNGGDRIVLYGNEAAIDCVAYGSGAVCAGKDEVDLKELAAGEFAQREPEGSGEWTISLSNTKSDNSNCIQPTPTNIPTPTPTKTPTPTQTPTPTSTATPIPTPTPTPTPTASQLGGQATPTSTKTPTPTPTETEEQENSGLVLGEEDFHQATPTPESGRSETSPNNVVLPIGIAVVGLGLIAFAAWPFFRSVFPSRVRNSQDDPGSRK